ncbi:hypothetical protein [Schaedlerella arabinosiphila]|uniref:hypothetical protein n=1 Tax=Schaedlerella arabinosiphila TaxID=2044587 RepID=UPI0002CCA0E8|nr:hypothetical protein [Schaedlerella arabinosiphila]KAI4443844.1 hypothetical protein C824_000272 [Schaedlerella arabinosiphila]
MEKKPSTPMTPFDEWTVPRELHILKLLIPYTPAASQQTLGILVKIMELQHTFQYFQQQKNALHSQEASAGFSSPLDMLEEIAPYLPPEQAEMLGTFRNMMNIMDMVQMMQEFSGGMETDFDPSGSPDSEASFGNGAGCREGEPSFGMFGGGFDPMQLMMGMLSPEQQEMFQMYQTMFSQPEEPAAAEAKEQDSSSFSRFEEYAAAETSFEHAADTFEETAREQPEEWMQDDLQMQDIERMDTNYE